MSKKLHLLVAALGLFIGSSVNAQVISQTGGATPDGGTVYCPTTDPQGSLTGISASSFYRVYNLNSNENISAIEFGAGQLGFAQGVTNFPITVKLYQSNGAFPGSFNGGLTELASANVNLTINDTMSLVKVPFSTPVSVTTGDIIVAEVSHSLVSGALFVIGTVSGNATGVGYAKMDVCGATAPVDITTIPIQGGGSPNGKIVIDLFTGTVSTNDFFKQNFSMYPNPVTDVLNITSINGLNANEIRVMDLTGKVVKVQNNASSVNVADLATGTYLIEITTNEGKGTSKFIKK